ncbi:hypothetical protein PENSPDRAFT_433032 [Peniophora sp. CONT]|nr:hypothetical protein PENSPDRAFT_433032 [Peniophora sp. CONT]
MPTPQKLILKLPNELLFRLLDILYDEWYIENLLKPGGFEYLGHRLILPNTPWNVLSRVCKLLRTVVFSHHAFITTLCPDLTAMAIYHRLEGAPVSVFYTDADNWEGVRGLVRPKTTVNIVAAANLALGTLTEAKSVRIDSVISAIDSPQKAQLLSHVIATLATTDAEKLQDLSISSSRSSTQAEDLVRASAERLWAANPSRFSSLKHLYLHNLPCISVPAFPPPSLVSLSLGDCALASGIGGLLDMLARLSRLHNLDLSCLSQFSPSIAFEKRVHRSIHLPRLRRLLLRDHIPALENILYHLDIPSTTDIELLSVVSPVNEQLNGSETYFRALALEVQSRLDGVNVDDVILSIRRRHPQFHVRAESSGQRRLRAEFDWMDESCDGLRVFVGELRALHGVTKLTIGPGMNLGEPFERQDRVALLHGVLSRFPNVKELTMQGDIGHVVWNKLGYSKQPIFPRLRKLVISDVFGDDFLLSDCFGWKRDGLRVSFVACPGLIDFNWSDLRAFMERRIAIDCSKIGERSSLIIDELMDDEQPGDDDWGSDEEDSDFDMEEA